MSGLSKIGFLLSKGRSAQAIASVDYYRTVVAAAATDCSPTKVLGLLMHVAKAKRIVITKSKEAKKLKSEVTYFRLLFFR
jgi:hypothetical protein